MATILAAIILAGCQTTQRRPAYFAACDGLSNPRHKAECLLEVRQIEQRERYMRSQALFEMSRMFERMGQPYSTPTIHVYRGY